MAQHAMTNGERLREALSADHTAATDKLHDVINRLKLRSRPDNDLTELLRELDAAISDFSSSGAELYHFDEFVPLLNTFAAVATRAGG